ncbi:TrkH family potassium uptake protein [Treponema sp.]|uniref:TrkH family potassium uptake protein n=1 Tax=Treponema sp. TaxID=166 RepID=UPI003F052B66
MTLTVFRIILFIISAVGISFVIPITAALFYHEYSALPAFLIPMAASLVMGLLSLVFFRKKKSQLSIRSSFAAVALAWVSASIFGALPLYFSGAIPSFTDALFESVSGFTTTGATILPEIESLPRSINLWRCLSHWIGGMGIVALTVALMPVLGVGGFQLIKAETTGPEKGKFTPKVTTTAKILWFIYLGMTAVQTLLLKMAGMDFIDALCHAFSTLSTGGFSPRNASIGSYNSAAVDWICFLFMFLAGINFTLYFYLFTGNFNEIKCNSELKAYIGINAICIAVITFTQSGYYGGFFKALRFSAFQTASIMTSTGFSTADYTTWSSAGQIVILMLLFIGGMSGSTSGGIKVIRWVILYKQMKNEMLKMIHPHGIFSVRLNQRAGRKDVVFSVAAFFFMYFSLVIITTFFGALSGMDVLTSFSGALTMVGNTGPAFGSLGPSNNYSWLAAPIKWWYSIAMIAGRLELFTIFIFFTPAYWKK